jgi:hypothetical protein
LHLIPVEPAPQSQKNLWEKELYIRNINLEILVYITVWYLPIVSDKADVMTLMALVYTANADCEAIGGSTGVTPTKRWKL